MIDLRRREATPGFGRKRTDRFEAVKRKIGRWSHVHEPAGDILGYLDWNEPGDQHLDSIPTVMTGKN